MESSYTTWTERTTLNQTHFTADWHFFDQKICGFVPRPFKSNKEMQEEIVARINDRVDCYDRLIVVGDATNGRADTYSGERPLQWWRDRINCRDIWLIRGNHDDAEDDDVFEQVHERYTFTATCGRQIYADHYPHAIWPASHRGSTHVYGHCHAQREPWMRDTLPDARCGDVGIDAARRLFGQYRPFSETEVLELYGSATGHHNPADVEHPIADQWAEQYGCAVNRPPAASPRGHSVRTAAQDQRVGVYRGIQAGYQRGLLR